MYKQCGIAIYSSSGHLKQEYLLGMRWNLSVSKASKQFQHPLPSKYNVKKATWNIPDVDEQMAECIGRNIFNQQLAFLDQWSFFIFNTTSFLFKCIFCGPYAMVTVDHWPQKGAYSLELHQQRLSLTSYKLAIDKGFQHSPIYVHSEANSMVSPGAYSR